jgi:hypothetical protein
MTSSNGLYEGIVVAVLAVVLVAFLVGSASMLIPYGLPHTADDIMATISIGFVAALITLPCAVVAAVVLGAPLLYLWRSRGFTSIPMHLFAGLIISALLALIMCVLHQLVRFVPDSSDFRLALIIAIIGGPVAALTAGYVARSGVKSSG